MSNRWLTSDVPRGAEYDARFNRLAEAGHDVHGEASFVASFHPANVLDAGCGTGRVSIELKRRGVDVVGVDIDRKMLEAAWDKEPTVEWFQADLASLNITDDGEHLRQFDIIIAAGNVMIFLEEGTEAAATARLADHLRPGGVMISGFQLISGKYGVRQYDADCEAVGLTLHQRYSSWSRDPWSIDSGYAVSVHRKPLPQGFSNKVDGDQGTDQPTAEADS